MAEIKRSELALIGGAAALRLANIGSESLWYDEAFTAWIAKLPPASAARAIAGDVHPPLWYVIEAVITRVFGNGEIALRLPAALLSVLGVYLVYRVCLALEFDQHVALWAGSLAALLPTSLYYAQDARMYPLLVVGVLLMLLGALRSRWWLFTLAGISVVYTQNLGLFYVFAIGMAALWINRKDMRPVIVSLLIVVLAWSLWAVIMVQQMQAVAGGFWLTSLSVGDVFLPLATMTMGQRIPDALQLHVYAASVGLTLVSLIVSRRWLHSERGFLFLTALLGAPVLTALISVVWHPIYLPRALLPTAMLLMPLWAYALTHLSIPNRRVAKLVLIPALIAGAVAHYYPASGSARYDVRSFVEPINAGWESGDIVYHASLATGIAFQYYLNKPYVLRPQATDLSLSISVATQTAMQFNQADFASLESHYKRVWLCVYINGSTKPDEYAALTDILTRYPHTLAKDRLSANAQMSIYLVQLGESNGR